MTISFKPAFRENVGLIIGLIGPTGCGKTLSAMRLAKGMSGGKRFAVIDTENGRALLYAPKPDDKEPPVFAFDHVGITEPFRPASYSDAIRAADDAEYPVIIVDSMSHEWAGPGGILDWHEEQLERMAGDDWQKRDKMKFTAWIKPKSGHKQMVQWLLQVRAHLIICFRAEEKIGLTKINGKMEVVQRGWQPITEKNLPYEMTVSLMLHSDNPGYPVPIKLQKQHRGFVLEDRPLDEKTGEALASWAQGGE